MPAGEPVSQTDARFSFLILKLPRTGLPARVRTTMLIPVRTTGCSQRLISGVGAQRQNLEIKRKLDLLR